MKNLVKIIFITIVNNLTKKNNFVIKSFTTRVLTVYDGLWPVKNTTSEAGTVTRLITVNRDSKRIANTIRINGLPGYG